MRSHLISSAQATEAALCSASGEYKFYGTNLGYVPFGEATDPMTSQVSPHPRTPEPCQVGSIDYVITGDQTDP